MPEISVIMPNYDGRRFIEAAVASVLAQTLADFELIVVDDASRDGSADLVAALARRDPRIRLLRSDVNTGPAGARNRGLAAARGRWVAVVDNDDLLHPERLSLLVAAAEAGGADIAADSLLIFDDDRARPPRLLQPCPAHARSVRTGLAEYVRSNALRAGGMPLGYLKPIFRATMLQATAIRYDPSLRTAEDYDFVARLLLAGYAFLAFPHITYFYRKHPASVSHRLGAAALSAMAANSDAFRATVPRSEADVLQAIAFRSATIDAATAQQALVAAIKARRWGDAARAVARRPGTLGVLAGPVLQRLRRVAHPQGARRSVAERSVCVISRQRIVGATNGSSAYLLSLCGALRAAGARVHLLCPSPGTFGRWPLLRLQPEMAVFDSIVIRGGVRVGGVIFALDPSVMWRAALTVADRLLARAGLSQGNRVAAAPYAIAADWTAQDSLFVARHAPAQADAILADYAFLTAAIPYALRVGAASAVVMHDMFSSRAAQFKLVAAVDSVASIDVATEIAILARAGAVIAIQSAEAELVRSHLPGRRVIVAPMPAEAGAAAQPGEGADVLFVASNTAPNVDALRWFVGEILPTIQLAQPDVRVRVAGSVLQAFPQSLHGVELLGRVGDLAPLYRAAAVVICPLRAGSGLKIKLIEALGHGKAIVATSVTLQGVEGETSGAVIVADDAPAFAAAVVRLLRDPTLRARQGEAALAVARCHFSGEACFSEAVRYLLGPASMN